MKLGVFGGTFDPVHHGHLVAAEEARASVGLDRVMFIPAGRPWLKAERDLADGTHRLKMVEAAISTNRHFLASDRELRRSGPTYSIDTLVELERTLARDGELFLIVGLDALREVERWHEPHRILELATVVGVTRPGAEVLERRPLEAVRQGACDAVTLVTGPLIGVSSTEVRRRVRLGKSIRYLVPEPVEMYIYEHELYKGTADG